MSLGIAFKGPEGLVLAADSRVTLFRQMDVGGKQLVIPATYDHATKLLRFPRHSNVGAITYGTATIDQKYPRTASSFIPEFESKVGGNALTVEEFAAQLYTFFLTQWTDHGMPPNPAQAENMFFFVAGYDPQQVRSRVFETWVPSRAPFEVLVDQFGIQYGGQREIVDRLLHGFDDSLPALAEEVLQIPAAQRDPAALHTKLLEKLALPIPWQFLPLQDCVDLAIFLVRTTIVAQQCNLGIRGVGGRVDVATVTPSDGFKPVQVKEIEGERMQP